MSRQRTFWDTDDAIFSEELADGNSHCTSPDTANSNAGLVVAPVSRTQPQEKAKATTTKEIYGPISFASSASVALQSCLASRLRERFGTGGSMEYNETWKEKATPLGLPYSAHTASARRTSDSGCTGELSGWMSPRARGDAGGTRFENGEIQNLEDQVRLAGWPTPTSMSYAESHQPGNNRSMNKTLELVGAITTSSTAQTENRGVLDAAFSRWLMGYPEAWDKASPNYDAWRSVQELIASGG